MTKPRLSFWQIVNMNVGFFGIQFSFGLQQGNMSPIYKYLGADEATLPLLWLAGPITGLVVQPLIGALSDKTLSRWGRRTPYFLVGAVLCSLGLLAMPFSQTLWVAAGLLWILDAANNVTMEPYRAYVGDRLEPDQHSLGFLTQSAFTGFAQTLAYLTPTLLVLFGMDADGVMASHIPYTTLTAFGIGAVFSIASIVWSLKTTPELPLSPAEQARIRAMPRGGWTAVAEVGAALRAMPPTMRQLGWMCLFQWYALFCYWQYVTLSLASTLYGTTDGNTPGFHAAGLLTGQIGAFYNAAAFVAAFAMVPFVKRLGAKAVHAFCLACAGVGLVALPLVHTPALLFVPMLGMGLAWASAMGNPYVLLAGSIPAERIGVYMGIFNMFIVVPMIVEIATVPLLYHAVLGGRPENVIRLAGGLFLCAAVATLRIRSPQRVTAAHAAGVAA